MPQSTSRPPSEGGADKKKASGLFRWLFLCAVTASLISVALSSYLRDLRKPVDSGVQICVQLCGTNGIKKYDAKQKICECSQKESK